MPFVNAGRPRVRREGKDRIDAPRGCVLEGDEVAILQDKWVTEPRGTEIEIPAFCGLG